MAVGTWKLLAGMRLTGKGEVFEMAPGSAGHAGRPAKWRSAALLRSACGQPATGPLAKGAGIVVDVRRIAQVIEEAGCVEGRVGTTALVVDQQQAEGAGPEFRGRHDQCVAAASRHQSKAPAREMLRTSDRMFSTP